MFDALPAGAVEYYQDMVSMRQMQEQKGLL
jgi:hypothetical protein